MLVDFLSFGISYSFNSIFQHEAVILFKVELLINQFPQPVRPDHLFQKIKCRFQLPFRQKVAYVIVSVIYLCFIHLTRHLAIFIWESYPEGQKYLIVYLLFLRLLLNS